MYSELTPSENFALVTGGHLTVGNIRIYPLTIGDITELGYDNYQYLLSTILITKDMIDNLTEEQLEEIEDYDVIVSNCTHNKKYCSQVESILSLLLREKVVYYPEYQFFTVGEDGDNLITRENFPSVANTIRLQNMIDKPKPKKRPAKESKKVRELREKMEKGRKMMAEAKNEKQEITLVDVIETVGTFVQDFNTINNWTLFQVHKAYEKFLTRESYQERYSAFLAGGDPKKLKIDTHWSRIK